MPGPPTRSDATVDAVDVAAYTVPTDAPEADGTLSWNATTLVLVTARCGDTQGIGWTYGPTACATMITDTLAGVVAGRAALDVAGSFDAMVKAVRNAGRPGTVGYAISAVDVALWDLKARLLDLPLHRLLGAVRERVPVYGSGGFTTYNQRQLHEQLTHWTIAQHIPRVKIKIGQSWGSDPDRDLDRMRQAREVIGPDVELFVDANGGYTRKQAIRVMTLAAAKYDVRWIEEPVSSDDLDGLRQIRDAVTADVTAGEYGYDLYYFRRMCAAGAVDCLQADVSRCGGITEWLRVAAVAASFGLEISGHCGPHLHAHAAAAVPNLRHLEWFHDHVRVESMFFDGTLDRPEARSPPTGPRPATASPCAAPTSSNTKSSEHVASAHWQRRPRPRKRPPRSAAANSPAGRRPKRGRRELLRTIRLAAERGAATSLGLWRRTRWRDPESDSRITTSRHLAQTPATVAENLPDPRSLMDPASRNAIPGG